MNPAMHIADGFLSADGTILFPQDLKDHVCRLHSEDARIRGRFESQGFKGSRRLEIFFSGILREISPKTCGGQNETR